MEGETWWKGYIYIVAGLEVGRCVLTQYIQTRGENRTIKLVSFRNGSISSGIICNKDSE